MSLTIKQGQVVTILDDLEVDHLRVSAEIFKERTVFVLPSIWRGRPVAHANPKLSQIRNFSTITKLVTTPSGIQVFLIRRYPLSWIHSLTDNLQRWMNGRGGFKPIRTSVWQKRFEQKSLIPVIKLGIKGVVALPYVPNYNLHDLLYYRVSKLSPLDIRSILLRVAGKLNELHARGITWGEPIVHNIIVNSATFQPTICDTEVKYFDHLSLNEQFVRDWWDFIFSACCAHRGNDAERVELARMLVVKIDNPSVKADLMKLCRQERTWRQKLFWPGMMGLLSFVELSTYNAVRQAISRD